jgi:hypothetical protein
MVVASELKETAVVALKIGRGVVRVGGRIALARGDAKFLK